MGRPARIATVHRADPLAPAISMDRIRYQQMSRALARQGHEVDMVVRLPKRHRGRQVAPNLREITYKHVDWDRYDVIKTFFHRGFDTLVEKGGGDHPFIISKLGSVVGRRESPGVYFFGPIRRSLYKTQLGIAERARAVTILTEQSVALWRAEHGDGTEVVLVPTGVDARLPRLGANPYRAAGIQGPVALFAGNIYTLDRQSEVNRIWQDRLNRLGAELRDRGITLVAIGEGTRDLLDPSAVRHMGPIEYRAFWDWQRHAQVGIVLAQGPVQDNESSKIYYYLRTALPVVCERPVPNAGLIEQTGAGTLVDLDDVAGMADAAARLVHRPPLLGRLPRWMVENHSWDVRARSYDRLIAQAVAEHDA